MTLVVTPVTTPEEMQQALAVRRRVFIDEQGFREAVETEDPNDDKPTTIHFVGKDSETGEYVAVARCLLDEPNRKAKFGRVAVLAKCRGKNFGAELMDAVEDHVRDRVDVFALSSQFGRKGFYEKCGYHCPSEEIYLEEGAKHCYMIKAASAKSD
ncbi:hypothetical protein PRIC1_008769 [Phytophthora ramorum]|uniref:putative acetyltransferase n=1 Tax=Phytophthora ramorum TaxID=164328 RepID=UPI0030B6EDA7|nr:putative acetyltransferase [Phytophthora ramorum]KAH7505374.1 putative acetyltransferase [Phytophthora ramorum]